LNGRKEGKGDELKGTTLRVYKYLLRAGKPTRISDLQHGLQVSSPSLIQYHLKKLLDLGLVREEQTGYIVEKVVVESVFRIRRTLIPFQFAYVVFFILTLIALIVIDWPLPLTSSNVLAIGVNISALASSCYEMIRTLRTIS
jgi:hypothetical protein